MSAAIRPRMTLLDDGLVGSIIDEAFSLLENHGIFVENENALKLLGGAGAQIDLKSQKACLGRSLVENALATTPSEIRLYDRTGEKSFIIGGDNVHFDPGSAAVSILDPETQSERKPVTRDLVRFFRLAETLTHIHFQSTALVSADVPHDMADAYRLYLGLREAKKPFITGTFRVESFAPMREMLTAIRGSAAALAEKPLAVFDACPSPPLKWSRLTSQSLIDAARAGIPSELISMGMTGATSPVTIAGTLVQHTAENLCGMAICQAARPGAPVIFGGSPSSFDMRRGTTPMGAIETMMIDAGYAQVGKALGMPVHAYMGLSDAKTLDTQAGLESALGAVLAALAGVNIVSGPGMLDFESCQSLEKLVVDDEICGMAYRLLDGISRRDTPLALDIFKTLGPDMSFLTHEHTRRLYRSEHTMPRLADRETYEAWVASGRKTMADRAREDVERRLSGYAPSPPEEPKAVAVREIMTAYARACGLDQLPDEA
ncbi:MAG: trimethylamine methyltransferase family protein [Acidobacteriota bacterium]|nr:trimethylamine methyltransferase family protein [Acidobacteriota bacterium]